MLLFDRIFKQRRLKAIKCFFVLAGYKPHYCQECKQYYGARYNHNGRIQLDSLEFVSICCRCIGKALSFEDEIYL